MGVAMSTVLLAENRHRHNQRCAERRIDGQPMIGHYDTWLIDLLQQLVQKNHAVTLYPHWSNASDYKDTEESFDTVALHSADLHQALENQCACINWHKVNLTREQKAICRAQGVKLPMLPFTSREEKKLFTKYYSAITKKTESDLAIWWCSHVNGVNIFPKLPVHFRMHLKQWLKNKRVENSIKAAKLGAEKLKEINNILSPFYSRKSPTATATSVSTSAATIATLPGTNQTPESREVGFPDVVRPAVMPQPSQQAMHNRPYTIVDGMLIGNNPGKRGGDKAPRKQKKCSKCRETGMYEKNPGSQVCSVGSWQRV